MPQTAVPSLCLYLAMIMSAKEVFISWDIDGTLVLGTNATRFHLEAFRDACQEVFGPCSTPEEFLGRSIDGWMDKSIVETMAEKIIGHKPSESDLERAQTRMEAMFREKCNEVPEVPRGVVETLDFLSKQPNVTMGLASGNFPLIAWHKLEMAGLDRFFPQRIGGLGVVRERKDAVALARKRAEEVTHKKFDIVMHIGDTPADVNAANAAGAIAVAVRTGRVTYPEYPTPSHVFADLIEGRDEIMKLLELSK